MTKKQGCSEGKLGYLGFLVILAGLLSVLFLWDAKETENEAQSEGNFSSLESESSLPEVDTKAYKTSGEVSKSDSATSKDQPVRVLSPQEIMYLEVDQKQWERSRGYFDAEDHELYASYDDTTLRRLANSGDLLALAIWAKNLKEEGHDEEAFQTQMIAAMYGSSEALLSISVTHETRSWDKDLTEQQRLQHLNAMLVYAEVAAMRGDRNGVVSGLLALDRQGVDLSKNEIDEISAAAKEIYSGLEEHRKLLGLGPFDNEEDPFLQIQMDFMASALPNPVAGRQNMSVKSPKWFT